MADCLLIDDSRLARRICRPLLEAMDFHVSEAENGEEGLNQTATRSFDMIVVDQFMTVLNGLDFIAQFRARGGRGRTPIILCSSDATPDLVHAALGCGANAYLNKPYTRGALGRTLRSLQLVPN